MSLQGLTDYDAILLEIYKATSCLFCKRNDKINKHDHCIVATLRKYDRPTLVEEVQERVFDTVTIKQKCLTRSKKRLSDLETKVDAIFSVSTALALR